MTTCRGGVYTERYAQPGGPSGSVAHRPTAHRSSDAAMTVRKVPFPRCWPRQGPALGSAAPRAAHRLPRFTVRDGEQYDFLTDLDAETLKRLAEVQGQLDGLGQHVITLRQMVQGWWARPVNNASRDDARQTRLPGGPDAARRTHRHLANHRRGRGGPAQADWWRRAGRTVRQRNRPSAKGRAVPWLVGEGGQRPPRLVAHAKRWEVTVVAGERLKALGAVRAVDARQGIVVMSDGRVVR